MSTMLNRLPRRPVSFYWSLGLHCAVKWRSSLPAAQTTNPTNMAKDQWVFFAFIFWMQTLWFGIYSLHQSCTVQTTYFWQSMKGYCFFCSSFASLPFLWCLFLFFSFLFFVMPVRLQNRNENAEEWRVRMALHWCSWDCSQELVYSPTAWGGWRGDRAWPQRMGRGLSLREYTMKRICSSGQSSLASTRRRLIIQHATAQLCRCRLARCVAASSGL